MSEICEADVKAMLGEIDKLILRELLRTKASPSELHFALERVRRSPAEDARAAHGLPTRVQRLVDLLSVSLDRDDDARPAPSAGNGLLRRSWAA